MAQMSRCCACKYYNFSKGKCKKYIDGIPEDIFVELEDCKYFIQEKSSDTDDGFPLAKGR